MKFSCIVGYGATTLPALTESVMYEHNSTLAGLEAGRLEELVNALTKNLKV
jgi:N-acetylated-alpha-linked acidic dipeptidase